MRYMTAEAMRAFIGSNVTIQRAHPGVLGSTVSGRLLSVDEYGPSTPVRIGGSVFTEYGETSLCLDYAVSIVRNP